MSVHSLIDKFQQGGSERGASSAKGTSSISRSNRDVSSTDKSSTEKTDKSHPNKSNKPSPNPTSLEANKHLIEKSGILSILGDDVKNFPYSEEAFIETVKYKIEAEKTKQHQIKLEIVNKNHQILMAATQANVPGYMIPQMCGNPNEEEGETSEIPGNDIPPLNYRFGAGTGPGPGPGPGPGGSISARPVPGLGPGPTHARTATDPMSHSPFLRKPISPAKVPNMANLTSSLTPSMTPSITASSPASNPYLFPRKPSTHNRHYSMPDAKLAPPDQQFPSSSLPSHSRSSSTSISGSRGSLGSSTMQVKPAPAQPLLKQSKSTAPPSQESMTSYQHVIQFHHWKPESPMMMYQPQSYQSPERTERTERSHKRHKSHADNMSVDLGSQVIRETGEKDDDEKDISMDTSINERR